MIAVEQVWKRYRRRGSYRTLREVVTERLSRPFGRPDPPRRGEEDFWALRDVSLEVTRGEAVGIVGPNGSGKTTLLKLLAGISLPTRGRIAVRGRIASLIELGAGFHPELTGRENVFLNGAILGLPRAEIRRRLDEIVAFAEVGPFLDLPLKRYSSGMVVRLGFAVAASADAQVLLMDEVLSVGDARFQQRCLGRMRELRQKGATVVLVSHSLPTVGLFCERALWLQRGGVAACGPAGEVIGAYQREALWTERRPDEKSGRAQGGDLLVVEGVRLLNGAGEETQQFLYREDLQVRLAYTCRERLMRPAFTLTVRGGEGRIFQASMLLDGSRPDCLEGPGEVECAFRGIPLAPGSYHVVASVRAADGVGYLMFPQVVGYFTVAADLLNYGWTAETAPACLPEVAPVIVSHEWRFHARSRASI
ncbi:MAG: ABC transporter ATP-binding protein [Candidatus Methylomirabilota bacterium]